METPRTRAGCLGTALGLLLGCSADEVPLTQVLVQLDAQPCVAVEAAAVRVRILDHEGVEVRNEQMPIATGGAELPMTIPIVPRGGDASRQFWVEAVLFDDADSELGTVRVAGRYLEGDIGEIVGCFTEACMGTNCGECTPTPPDGGVAACETCAGDPPVCGAAATVPVPMGEGGAACPPIASSCMGDVDAGTPPDCEGPSDCDDGEACTMETCADGVCESVPADADGDGHAALGCLGGDDCNDSAGSVHPGAPEACGNGIDDDCDGSVDENCCAAGENCSNGLDDDCDGAPDCYDTECGADPYCNARRCRSDDGRWRWCSGRCVDTFNDTQHCGSCEMRCLNGRSCTLGPDGNPRCYCTSDLDCPFMINCNVAHNRCGCNATSCGAGTFCQGVGGGVPAYCVWEL